MLRKIFSLMVGKKRREPQSANKVSDEQDFRCLNEIKNSLQFDFSFLRANYEFQIIAEKHVDPDGCFIVLQNEVMQLRVSSGGRLGGYGWSVGDNSADLVFEMGSGWLNVLRFVNIKLGADELLPKTDFKSWEPIPIELLRSKYSQVLSNYMPEISRLFRTYKQIDLMPNRVGK